MGTVHRFRDYETAARKYRDKPHVYQALVRRMVADEKAGRSTRLALQEAYAETHGYPIKPEPAA